jgi:hypothetical protein
LLFFDHPVHEAQAQMKRWSPQLRFRRFYMAFAALCGLLIGVFAPWVALSEHINDLYVWSGLAGLVSAYIVSRWFIRKPHKPLAGKTALAGFIFTLLVHPVCWLLVFVSVYLRGKFLSGYTYQSDTNFTGVMVQAAFFTLWSMVLVGLPTMFLGIGGAFLARWFAWKNKD